MPWPRPQGWLIGPLAHSTLTVRALTRSVDIARPYTAHNT
jgi:hypothetical protein